MQPLSSAPKVKQKADEPVKREKEKAENGDAGLEIPSERHGHKDVREDSVAATDYKTKLAFIRKS